MTSMNTKHCEGCRDNFYNGHNPMGVEKCWRLEDAKLVSKYQLSVHTPMDRKSGYHKRRVPSCYHKEGFGFMDKIPEHAS